MYHVMIFFFFFLNLKKCPWGSKRCIKKKEKKGSLGMLVDEPCGIGVLWILLPLNTLQCLN